MKNKCTPVDNYISMLKKSEKILQEKQSAISTKITNIKKKIHLLECLSEEDKNNCLDIEFMYYSEIPTRIRTCISNYAKANNSKPLTARDVFNLGIEQTRQIPGIGKWSIVDIFNFFKSKGYDWK